MDYKGAFGEGELKKYQDGTQCRQTEQRMELKIENGELKVNVEEKSTLHVELANSPWSVEKDGIERQGFQREEAQNPVKSFPANTTHKRTHKPLPNVPPASPKSSPKGKDFPLSFGEGWGEASERVGERLEEILERLASDFDEPFTSC